METIAVVLKQPKQVEINRLALTAPTAEDVVVDVAWSGVSTGTERLLWSGRMPAFPGMGYPLVPGYESVGEVVEAGSATDLRPGAFRHPDHRFEWTRPQFRDWAGGVASRHGYQVRFVPVGRDDPGVGPPTQMAVFTRA